MLLFESGDSNYIGVLDIVAATTWYCEKLGLRKVDVGVEEHCVTLGFRKEVSAICLGPPDPGSQAELTIIYSSDVKKAHELLSSRGVNVTEIREDRQGTHYFEMRDCEGNVIEISEDP